MEKKITSTKTIRYLQNIFYFWLFLLPWQTRYFFHNGKINNLFWEAGSMVIYVSDIVLVFLAFTLLFLKFRDKTLYKIKIFGKWYNSVFLSLSSLVVFSWFSIIWSANHFLSFYYALKIVMILMIFWLIKNLQISRAKVGVILIISGLIQSMMAINQFLSQFIPASKWLGIAIQDARELGVSAIEINSRRWLRAYGSFPHPNILGGFLAIVLVFLLERYQFVNKQIKNNFKSKFYHLGLLLTFIFIGSGLALSLSRAAWLAIVFIWLVFFIFVIWREKKQWLNLWLFPFMVFLFGVSLWVVVYPEVFQARIFGEERLEVISNQQRIISMKYGKDIAQDYFPLGTGVGAYTWAFHELKPKYPVWLLQQPHNFYLLIFSELGVFGLVLFLWIIYTSFKNSNDWRNKVLILTMLFLMMFDHWWWSLNFGWYFMVIILGLATNKKKLMT